MARIMVITPIITRGLRDIADLRALERDGLSIEHTLIDEGPASIECEMDEALAVPGILTQALRAEREGCDGVVIDCFGDPGLNAARELLRIPVLGPGESSMHAAAMLGHRFSVISVVDSVRPLIANLTLVYGLASKLASIRVIDIPVLSLGLEPGRMQQAMSEQACRAVTEDGADVIVLGCTGFLGCAESVTAGLAAQGIDVPVIDPIPVTLNMVRALCESGLRHSKRTWPQPQRKPLVGFAALSAALH